MSDPHVTLKRTTGIVSAYVTKNSLPPGELPAFLKAVHAALVACETPPVPVPERPRPPVPIKKTITADRIISLEDGKPYKSLKRHLSSRGMTPDEYRQKWGLPSDCPMVAEDYAKERSEMAKRIGLGRRSR